MKAPPKARLFADADAPGHTYRMWRVASPVVSEWEPRGEPEADGRQWFRFICGEPTLVIDLLLTPDEFPQPDREYKLRLFVEGPFYRAPSPGEEAPG